MTDSVTLTYTPDQELYGISLATRNGRFRDRISAAMVLVAKNVWNEDKPSNVMDYERWTAALEVQQNPAGNRHIDKFVWWVATAPAVSATFYVSTEGVFHDASSDDDLIWTVGNAWNQLLTQPEHQTPPDVS